MGASDKTMIEQTLERLDGFIPPERRIIVTHEGQLPQTQEIVGAAASHFLAEPEARNTAAALTMAALEIRHLCQGRDAIMMSFHADHMIADPAQFRCTLRAAREVALKDKLVLLGMKPGYPETGYGYIEKGESFHCSGSWLVRSFKEKPALELAREYVSQGGFFWNSGIFIWSTSVFLGEVSEYLLALGRDLSGLQRAEQKSFSAMDRSGLASVYERLQNIAVDHGILEVSKNTAVVEGDFGWKDVGSWGGLAQSFPPDQEGNLVWGDAMAMDSEGCVIDSDGPLVACLGLKDLVVVASGGAILVCPKDRSQDVRKIVSQLKRDKRDAFL